MIVRGEKMKKWYFLVVAGIIVIFLGLVFPFHLFLPASMVWSGTEVIEAGGRKGPSLGLFWFWVIVGSIQVSGGNQDIYFYIKDSGGKRVFDPGTIYSGYSFIWAVPKTDSFSFNCDNSMSWFTTKTVYWTLKLYPYNVAFAILGFLLLVLGVFAALKEEEVFQKIKTWKAQKPTKRLEIIEERKPVEKKKATLSQLIAQISSALGIVFIFFGLITWFYHETFLWIPIYVYRDYALPLFILGVSSLIVGIIINMRESK